MTACVVLLVTGFLYLRPWPRARALYVYGLGSAALLLLAAVVFSPEAVLNTMGRDTSLTGRMPLWQAISGIIAERPFLGHGYSGFWDATSPAVQDLWQRVGWQAPDAHNGYLDIMIQLGVVGAALYALIWARIIHLALQARRSRTLPAATWVLLVMLVNILVNLDEGPLPWADAYTLVMPSLLIMVEIWNETARRLPVRARARPSTVYLDLSQFGGTRAASRQSQADKEYLLNPQSVRILMGSLPIP
jgi:exopolysaccharide production protein ExoQ